MTLLKNITVYRLIIKRKKKRKYNRDTFLKVVLATIHVIVHLLSLVGIFQFLEEYEKLIYFLMEDLKKLFCFVKMSKIKIIISFVIN